jgi:5-methylcytosine-specific restriction protein A
MSKGAHHECRAPLCPGYAVKHGYCQAHQALAQARLRGPVYDPKLQTSHRRVRWMRRAFLRRHPLCAVCHEPASVLDHVKPHRGDPALFWDQDNWQALCVACHGRKTARETLAKGGQGAPAAAPGSSRPAGAGDRTRVPVAPATGHLRPTGKGGSKTFQGSAECARRLNFYASEIRIGGGRVNS